MTPPRLTIRARLYLGFAALVGISLGLAGYGMWSLERLDRANTRQEALAFNMMYADAFNIQLEIIRHAQLGVIHNAAAPHVAALGNARGEALKVLQVLRAGDLQEDRAVSYAALAKHLEDQAAGAARLVTQAQTAFTRRDQLIAEAEILNDVARRLVEAGRGEESVGVNNAADNLERAVLNARVEALRFLATRDPAGVAETVSRIAAARRDASILARLAGGRLDEYAAPLNEALTRYSGHFEASAKALLEATELFNKSLLPLITRMQETIHTSGQSLRQELAALTEAAHATTRAVGRDQTIGAGVGLLLGLALAVIIARGISGPLGAMTAAMEELAQGKWETEIPARGRRDEMGAMAEAVEVFKRNGIAAREAGEREKAEQAEKEARALRLAELVRGFESKAAGLVGSLSAAATQLEGTAQAMTGTATETNERASTVAGAAQEMSANVQTVSASAEELGASINEISRQVAQSAEITAQAVRDAERTDGIVRALADGAEKIGAVVGLINNIAGQTNLLALNATIEAARAGDAGKGFAVVASEVKSLAGQTAKATDEISQQIGQIQTSTQEAVLAIKGIVGTIGEVSQIAGSIAAAVEEQGAATAEIARNVQQAAVGTQDVTDNIAGVSAAANETGAAAGQVLGAAGELAKQAEALSGEVKGFVAEVRAA